MSDSILAALRAFGVSITAPAVDRLKLAADNGDVPPAAVDMARTHKAELLALFRTPEGLPFPEAMIYCPHDWQDTAEGDGITRRFCSTCGRFGGFVLANGLVTEELPV